MHAPCPLEQARALQSQPGMAVTGNGHLEEEASFRLDQIKQKTDQLLERVESFIRTNPAASIAIAVGAGFVIGRLARR
jgi:ElaB/YqjD/DUF883 family membrane-anchored ribosome-binding protein